MRVVLSLRAWNLLDVEHAIALIDAKIVSIELLVMMVLKVELKTRLMYFAERSGCKVLFKI